MTDWKMPEWMRDVFWDAGYADYAFIESYYKRKSTDIPNPLSEHIVKLITSTREHRLLSTPTERDANDKRLEIITEQGKTIIATMTERDKLVKRIAALKAALDNAKHENTAAWVLNEKLKKEADK